MIPSRYHPTRRLVYFASAVAHFWSTRIPITRSSHQKKSNNITKPFSIATAALRVTTAFSAYINAFEYIQLGRRFSQDFQTEITALNRTRIQLTRWAQAVDIYGDQTLKQTGSTAADIQIMKDILLQIVTFWGARVSV